MAVYAVVGKLGTGKTKFAVRQAQVALMQGRRVSSNVDLHLDKLVPTKGGQYVRLPDKPKAFDLDAAGHGNPGSYDEDRNGVMLLDELGTWLNSRSFQDKERAGLIDWLIHARKHGWDVYLIVQDSTMIDKQVREALVEYEARCTRLDKVKIPMVAPLFGLVADLAAAVVGPRLAEKWKVRRWGYLPKIHMVVARLGTGQNAVIAERWMYRGLDLHAAYDTRQVFSASYPHGSFSLIWRPPPKPPGLLLRLAARLAKPPRPALRPKLPEVQALAALPPSQAWAAARSLAQGGPYAS